MKIGKKDCGCARRRVKIKKAVRRIIRRPKGGK